MDDTWLDAFAMLELDLPVMQAGINKIEQRKAEIRANHPAYKKH